MVQSHDATQPLAEADMPPHIRQRLEEETERFHHPHSVDEDLAAASKRHNALLHSKAEHAHEQVEHAKQVAATHTSDPSHSVPTKATHNPDDIVKVKEQSVQEKRRHVEQQRAELGDLEARLRRADQIEQSLRAKLGTRA